MSASLVGSEMCIRDRPPTAPAPPARHRGSCSAWHARPARPPPGGAPRTVSYTHLTLPTICSV
eukprot:6715524-Alexandrium_andersonii.AAC.1